MGGRESRARAKNQPGAWEGPHRPLKRPENRQGWVRGGSFALRNSSITDWTSSLAWTNS
jgi:hypothetical protein